ncbi:hypothetical protein EXIGLDRAFT_410644 [Exidia glandulosa HHB12029]|uniref:Uncharacterized protein n=1 Tax=Exidia glandulosa HHB12029 TaxID=1314781 RepID=A0A165KNA5_EXIGL|nr:hypothetical protein EXIGLDRAFT_410644 [Exidia glandulosa HHB12029]
MTSDSTHGTQWSKHINPQGRQYFVDADRGRVVDGQPVDVIHLRVPHDRTTEYWSDDNSTWRTISRSSRECLPLASEAESGSGHTESARMYWQFRALHPNHRNATKQEYELALTILNLDCARSILGTGTTLWSSRDSAQLAHILSTMQEGTSKSWVVASVLSRAA